MLHATGASETVLKRSLVLLKRAAKKDDALPMVLDLAVNSFVNVEPANLRDPQFAVELPSAKLRLDTERILFSYFRSRMRIARSARGRKRGQLAKKAYPCCRLCSPEPQSPDFANCSKSKPKSPTSVEGEQ